MAEVPMVIVFCFTAFILIVALYMCMQRIRAPPPPRKRDEKFAQMTLPGAGGESSDVKHVAYLCLNCANSTNVDVDYPKFEEGVDRSEQLTEYREQCVEAEITSRGLAQIETARDGIYDRHLRRVVVAYSSPATRCMQTAHELLMIGQQHRKAQKCAKVVTPLRGLSQNGFRDEKDGRLKTKVPKQYEIIEDAIQNIGTHECDLNVLYEQPTGTNVTMRTMMKNYTKPNIYGLNHSLDNENRNALHQRLAGDLEDDIVLIVGQTPYINAIALQLADVLGHTKKEREELEQVNLGDLDGFLITRRGKSCLALNFEDEDPEIESRILRNANENAINKPQASPARSGNSSPARASQGIMRMSRLPSLSPPASEKK
eukprot:TRINITY_DN6538_c1_g2_i1.p1 TRINITY_DN6538_c1_g2~~TRINITY_DN6538_c1_g2_i1.p1  ORF type:complete len:372 (+),score=53.42 TRINITY_DN6538_c1_g2_i1:57-1172(+)